LFKFDGLVGHTFAIFLLMLEDLVFSEQKVGGSPVLKRGPIA